MSKKTALITGRGPGRAKAALALMLAALAALAQAQALSLAVKPNQTLYAPGDTVRLSFELQAPDTAANLDLLVGILSPDERSVLFLSSLSPAMWHAADFAGDPRQFVPLLGSATLPAGYASQHKDLLVLDTPQDLAAGNYSAVFMALRHEGLADGSLDAGDIAASARAALEIKRWAPPQAPTYAPYKALYASANAAGSLYVTATQGVRAAALAEAQRQLDAMLRYRPDVVASLRAAGALIAVFAEAESVCDLSYFDDLQDRSICTSAPGGVGGVPGRPVTACSERNLLKLASDQYGRGTRENGENVCVHEIAHLIMNVGLSDAERSEIRAQYARAKASGIWGTDYVMTNADEYFAEISQAYFCTNPEIPTYLHATGVNCPYRLQQKDPESFALMERLYRGSTDLR